jgi:hypothetical protein
MVQETAMGGGIIPWLLATGLCAAAALGLRQYGAVAVPAARRRRRR